MKRLLVLCTVLLLNPYFAPAQDPAQYLQTLKTRCIGPANMSGRITEVGADDALSLEPLFVPAPDARAEDDGVLLVHRLADDDAGSRICVLDAATLETRATVELPRVVPFGFHGAWAPA